MKKKTDKYSDYPISAKVIEDILPKPEDLVLKTDTIKVTLSLNADSIDFFKQIAKENHTQYQKMIRNLLDHYVSVYKPIHQEQSINNTHKKDR